MTDNAMSGFIVANYTTPPTTPSPSTTAAQEVVEEIIAIYSTVKKLPCLSPSLEVDRLFSRLVDLCVAPCTPEVAQFVLNMKGLGGLYNHLQSLCATAEGKLERHHALRILHAVECSPTTADTKEILFTFPYYKNYVDLCRLECSTMETFLPTSTPCSRPVLPRRIAFIGSGAMPLTSYCLLDRYPEVAAHNIDRDIDALQISRDMAACIGYAKRMTFACEDVAFDGSQDPFRKQGEQRGFTHTTDWHDYQVVYLGALVGMGNAAKFAILTSLARKLAPGTLLIVRSAYGLRKVLYPELEISDGLLRIGYNVLAVVHPFTRVVNSIVVLKVKDR